MRYFIKITAHLRRSIPTVKQHMWTNGGRGYDESELGNVFDRLDNDPRVVKYELVEKKGA